MGGHVGADGVDDFDAGATDGGGKLGGGGDFRV